MIQVISSSDHSDPDQHLESLLCRLARGESENLESVYRITKAAVFGLALSIVRQYQDAEDVTHDTYVRLYQAAGGYEALGKPMAWILTIAKNLLLMKLRDRARQTPFEDGDSNPIAEIRHNLSVEDKLVLQACLEELTEDEQMIVVLHAVSGWKHREVAGFMKIPVQHAIVKYNRAIRKLARRLKQADLS